MSYSKQNFENGTVLTAEHLNNLELGILSADVSSTLLNTETFVDGSYSVFFIKKQGKVAPIFEKSSLNSQYYFYETEYPGVLSLNGVYKKQSLYSQSGQDGTIYKGLSFRGSGSGTVTIKDVHTGTNKGTMTWDKFTILKPHDNSVTKTIKYGENTPYTTTWELNSTYTAPDGNKAAGNRAIAPKINLDVNKNISVTIKSCKFIVACYDVNDVYLGQITPDLNSLLKGTGQWLEPNTIITENIIKSINTNICYIGIVSFNNSEPEYDISTAEEICYMYSNIYNSYASSTDKHIGECCVYKVYEDSSNTWKNELKQLLKIEFINNVEYWPPSSEPRPYGNFVVDEKNNALYVYTMYTSKKLTYWYKFNLPDVDSGEYNSDYGCNVYTLTLNDVIDSFKTEHHNYVQGGCYHNNLIYTTEGFNGLSGENLARMRIIDPTKKQSIAILNFFSDDDPVEPEFVEFDNNTCYYGSIQKMYTLEFI